MTQQQFQAKQLDGSSPIRHIGETECELFCGYDETDRIHQALDSFR